MGAPGQRGVRSTPHPPFKAMQSSDTREQGDMDKNPGKSVPLTLKDKGGLKTQCFLGQSGEWVSAAQMAQK